MEEKDVNVQEETSPEQETQEVVNEVSETDQQEQNAETQEISTDPSGVGQSPAYEVDEMGVPWKNRAMEFKRKFEDQTNQLSELKEMIQGLQQGSQKPKYTVAQLRAYAASPDITTQERVWAEAEIEKLQKAEMERLFEEKLTSLQKKQQANLVRSEALRTVQQRHPEAFNKDAQGRPIGWNNSSPLTQRIAQYMQDPEIANNPRGLLVATAMANWDLSQNTQIKSKQLKQEVKDLQKKTMFEGGGKSQPIEKNPVRKALDNAKSGSKKDATNAMKEILKARGIIEE